MNYKLKKKFKKLLLEIENDETDSIHWVKDKVEVDHKPYYNCGCCDNCSCEENKPCSGCECNCNRDDFDDDYDYIDDDEYPNDDNIQVVMLEDKEKKVKIQLKITLDTQQNEVISFDLDINKHTYLKITNELN